MYLGLYIFFVFFFTWLKKATMNQLLSNRLQITAYFYIIQFVDLEPLQFPLKESHVQLLCHYFGREDGQQQSLTYFFLNNPKQNDVSAYLRAFQMLVCATYHAGQTTLCHPHSPEPPWVRSRSFGGSKEAMLAEKVWHPGQQGCSQHLTLVENHHWPSQHICHSLNKVGGCRYWCCLGLWF